MSSYSQDFPPNPNDPQQPIKQSASGLKWIIIIVATVFILGLLCCGGFGLLGFVGLKMAGSQIQEQIKNDPVIVEEIGEIRSVSMSLTKTTQRANEQPDGEQVVVFDIEGDRGTGVLVGEQGAGGQFSRFRLEKDGQVFELSQ